MFAGCATGSDQSSDPGGQNKGNSSGNFELAEAQDLLHGQSAGPADFAAWQDSSHGPRAVPPEACAGLLDPAGAPARHQKPCRCWSRETSKGQENPANQGRTEEQGKKFFIRRQNFSSHQGITIYPSLLKNVNIPNKKCLTKPVTSNHWILTG